MATLEKRLNRYRVVLRLNGKKISRSIKSKNEVEAQAALARIRHGLRRLELGLLTPPDGADVITFLFSDGHVTGKRDAPQLRSLRQLSEAFFASIIKGSLETATLSCMKTHLSHFKRILGSRFLFAEIQQTDLRRYAEQRLQERGRRGAEVSPVTIRKELNSLRTVWNWATDALPCECRSVAGSMPTFVEIHEGVLTTLCMENSESTNKRVRANCRKLASSRI